jgi:allantoate deiminase
MIVAEKVPATMLFIRSPGGLSHHPDEAVLEEDVRAGLEVGLLFLKRLNSSKTQGFASPKTGEP